MANRELVTLANVYDPDKHMIGGWLASEKLDGTRCFWDGGLTRGVPISEVPYSNKVHPKTGQPKPGLDKLSTGLWSRYGNPIFAPDWFINNLPPFLLDGELFAGRGNFQTCRSIVSPDIPDDRWEQIEYVVYGAPSLEDICKPGTVKNGQCNYDIPSDALTKLTLLAKKHQKVVGWAQPNQTFVQQILHMTEMVTELGNRTAQVVRVHLQNLLKDDHTRAVAEATKFLNYVVEQGGEGIMLRDPNSFFETKRINTLLKMKPCLDDEATLVGFTAGKGKFKGMIGALITDYKGKRLELSGMTNEERTLLSPVPPDSKGELPIQGTAMFQVGQKITFAYRELTDAQIPKEARYMRVRNDM